MTLLATATPRGYEWSPTIALIMLACNLLAIAFAKYTVERQDVGPKLPIGGISVPLLLGATSFGHILGAGVILALSNSGAI